MLRLAEQRSRGRLSLFVKPEQLEPGRDHFLGPGLGLRRPAPAALTCPLHLAGTQIHHAKKVSQEESRQAESLICRRPPTKCNPSCIGSGTEKSRSHFSTKARAPRSCSCTACPRTRKSTGSIRDGCRRWSAPADAPSRSTTAAMAGPPSPTIPPLITPKG